MSGKNKKKDMQPQEVWYVKSKVRGGASMELMVKASPRYKLKDLALKSKQRREQMKKFIFTEKDKVANENFNDLEKEIYPNIK